MTDHPLTETVAAEMWDEHHTPAHPILRWALAHESERKATLALLRAAFDAGREHERTNPEDPRPWEPLNGGPVRVGDEVRRELDGITTIAVVGRVDGDGDPWTAKRAPIGMLSNGTWHVRRPVQDVPTEPGTVLEPADGHEYITATIAGHVYRAREAMLSGERWHAVWRRDSGRGAISFVRSHEITPGTWKVDGE